MTKTQPLVWIESTWLPVDVLAEHAPKRERDAGFIDVRIHAVPKDGGKIWAKYGGRSIRVPAYMVYGYEPKNQDVKANKFGGKPLGGYGALKGSTPIARSTRQADAILDLDDPGSSISSTGPVMYEGAGAEMTETPILEKASKGRAPKD